MTIEHLLVEILDIDYFKEYNDNYGHQAGDACIVAIADELRKMQSHDTFCARYGGDEFIIIYEYKTEDEVFSMADSLRERILDRRIEHVCSKALPVVTTSRESVLTWLRREAGAGISGMRRI